MRKRFFKIVLIVLLNLSPCLLELLCFSAGAPVHLVLIPIQAGIVLINYDYTQKARHLFLFNFILIISSLVGILGSSLLYFKFICYDFEGVIIMKVSLAAGSIYVTLLTVVSILIKYLTARNKSSSQ